MTMTFNDLIPLLPILITVATTVVVMLAIAARRHHGVSAALAAAGLAAALWSAVSLWSGKPAEVTSLLLVDQYALFFSAVILALAIGCTLLCFSYIDRSRDNREELYLLLLCATAGALVLVSAQHLTALFVGLELMSIPLFGMVGYLFRERASLEACIKYLVLSAVASAVLLFGLALLYADAGSLGYKPMLQHILSGKATPMLVIGGFALVMIGLGFKLSLVPFHFWTPDVYAGAPAPVGAFLATVSKLAVLAVLLRIWMTIPIRQAGIPEMLAALAVASILVGNLLALRQDNLKRVLGYSSIAHVGYLLVAILAFNALSIEAIAVYAVTYGAASLGAFAVISLASSPLEKGERATLAELQGLFWRSPWLAGALTVMLLSLAGVPLTAGFIAKFYVLSAGLASELWWLVATVLAGSAIGIYYYLRAMLSLYGAAPVAEGYPAGGRGVGLGSLMVVMLALFVLAMGVYPQPMLSIFN